MPAWADSIRDWPEKTRFASLSRNFSLRILSFLYLPLQPGQGEPFPLLPRDIQMKILLWIVAIIFVIGLLVVTGVLKLIF